MQTLPTPTTSQAIDYVRAHFASYSQTVTICGTIAPARDSSGPLIGARDVLFLADTGNRPARFAVWFEQATDGQPYLYGEW